MRDAYRTVFTEDGLRRIIGFLEPRIRVLQLRWRAYLSAQKVVASAGKEDEERRAAGKGSSESPTSKAKGGKEDAVVADITTRGLEMLKALEELTKKEEQRKANAHALSLARLMVINLRAAKQRKRLNAVRSAASHWKSVAADAWPASLKHVCDALPVKDARQLVRRCHEDPQVDPMFANKKIWVCETCCRLYNAQAREVFEAAETREVADLCGDIWARIHTLESLMLSLDGDGNGTGSGGDGRGEEVPCPQQLPVLTLPPVRGAVALAGSSPLSPADASHHHLRDLPHITERPFTGSVVFESSGLSASAAAGGHAGGSQREKGGKQGDAPAQKYPVTEVPAHCTPRNYQSLDAFAVRMREGPEPDRSWWRPAGRQGWASAADLELPPGFKVPTIPASPTVVQRERAARAAYLEEAARLRVSLRAPDNSMQQDSNHLSPAALSARARGTGKQQGCEPSRQALSGEQLNRIPGITPRARWFQPRAAAWHAAAGAAAAGIGEAAPPGAGEADRRGAGEQESVLADSMSTLENLPDTIARLRAAVERHEAQPPDTGVARAVGLLLGDDLPVASRENIAYVQDLLASRFADIYGAFAAFGPGALQEWKLSPSRFFRGMLALGADEERLVLVMEALAPCCRSGFLTVQAFVTIFNWESTPQAAAAAGGGARGDISVANACEAATSRQEQVSLHEGSHAPRHGSEGLSAAPAPSAGVPAEEAEHTWAQEEGGSGAAEEAGGEAEHGSSAVTAAALAELIEEGSQLLDRLPSEAASQMSKLVAEASGPGAPGSQVARALHAELAEQQVRVDVGERVGGGGGRSVGGCSWQLQLLGGWWWLVAAPKAADCPGSLALTPVCVCGARCCVYLSAAEARLSCAATEIAQRQSSARADKPDASTESEAHARALEIALTMSLQGARVCLSKVHCKRALSRHKETC